MGKKATWTKAQALTALLVGQLMPWFAHSAPPKNSGCLIEPEQTADIGSPVTGVVEQLPVALGDSVNAGQPVVILRADVERANAQVAETRSRVDAEARAAQANVQLAQQKVKRTRQLLAQSFVSEQAVEQAEAEAEVAQQKYKLARSQQQIYQQEQSVAKAQLGMRTLRSPITGVVVERFSNLGERVDDRPVMRIASIDPLRVSLMIPITQYGQLKEGDVMVIRPELPGANTVQATIRYVDKVVDAASNTFRVRLSLPNPDHRLPGGLRCKAELSAKAPPAPPAPAAAALPVAPSTTSMRAPATQMATTLSRLPAMAMVRQVPPVPAKETMTLRTAWTLSVRPHAGTAVARSTPASSTSLAMGHPMWLVASLSLSPRR